MPAAVADSQLDLNPTPAARFGVGATRKIPGIVRGTGCAAAVIGTDAALAAVNPQRGRDLDYRSDFRVPALPIVAVPTTAGTGAETNAFGVVTDPQTRRKFYVGHASSLPAAAVLDPDLTIGLPPLATAATGMDALTHALESYLSIRANPWSEGTALQVIRMIAANLPGACADGTDRRRRAQMPSSARTGWPTWRSPWAPARRAGQPGGMRARPSRQSPAWRTGLA
jgi:alcohol dehydrogenase YqhD (iron-dependent ADH family)